MFFKRLLFLFLLFFGVVPLWATHQKAAEISFAHVSGYTYKATLITYTFTESEADRPELEISWGDGYREILQRASVEVYSDMQTQKNVYHGTHTYSGPGTYVLYMEDPNRNGGVVNMPNSINTPMYVQTVLVISPYLSSGNSTPKLLNRPIDDKACVGRKFIHNPGAYDKEGDSISYKLSICKTTGGEPIVGYTFPYATDSFSINERSGDVLWINPADQGEYNVAILIQEWRNQRQISEMTRDMQIIVQTCDNYPPDIFSQEKYCVEAGKNISFELFALDADANNPQISFTSEISDSRYPVSLNPLYKGIDSASYEFVWRTSVSNSRAQPYVIYFKATDRGEPPLSDLKSVFIYVLAPAVENLQAKSEPGELHLNWDKTKSSHAIGYKLYRKSGRGNVLSDSCTSGVGEEYKLIKQITSISETNYIDTDSLIPGMSYCYRVTAYFQDGAESYASEEACADIFSYVPIITEVSVKETDIYEGIVNISWRSSHFNDSVLGDKVYELQKGINPDNLSVYGYFQMDSVVSIKDSNINTEQHAYYYKVGLVDTIEAFGAGYLRALSPEQYLSPLASSVFLKATPHSRRATLDWSYKHPWINEIFNIYRLDPGSEQYKVVGRVRDLYYIDTMLQNDETYKYYIEAVGSYYSDQIPEKLKNLSNTVSVVPRISDPCKPYLVISEQNCIPLSNTLVWSFDSTFVISDMSMASDMSNTSRAPGASNIPATSNATSMSNALVAPAPNMPSSIRPRDLEDCYSDISYYKIYYRRYNSPQYREIAQEEEMSFVHEHPDGYLAFYKISAVNTLGVEGPMSEEVYADNRHCFSYRLPNVFTPNGDGHNDYFKAFPNQYVEGFRISIYNRLGGLVYTSKDPEFEWNGCFNGGGKECPTGVYFYVVEFVALEGEINLKQAESGSVTILR